MKITYFLFLLFIACTSVRSEKSEIPKMDIDCHVHVNRNSNDDMQFDPKRAQLAYKSVGFQRSCLISPTFLMQNNPVCWTKGGQCLEDSAWVNQTHQWLANEIKSLADGSVGLCGIDPNYKDWEQLIEFCKKNWS